MKSLKTKLFLLFALLCSVSACAGFSSNVWPSTAKCAGPVAGALFRQVEAALVTGVGPNIGADAIATLEKLAADYGVELVTCVVSQFIIKGGAQPSMQAMQSMESGSGSYVSARAEDFLNRHGVNAVVTSGGGG